MSEATCTTCGAPLMTDAAFCQQCGVATGLPPIPPGPSILDRLQAALGDRYRVERELGRGGMATVFLAHDVRHDRPVAVKVLDPDLAASVGAERFEREIRVAAKLSHPHILSLHDSGAADGLLYYVMPFVKGESLRDRLHRESMLPLEDAIQITLEVADALGHAHSLGIVHRDIKPENIMMSAGHALVTDFGIARAVSSADDSKLTKTGTAVGTPLYMSPEQAMGDEAGPTSDLYSLACVSFEMLTGQPPFTGANPRAIMARHTMEAVPGIRLVRDSVPEEVEEALLWALAKVPADRPQSAAQFVEALGTPLGATATRRVLSRPRVTAIGRRSGAAGGGRRFGRAALLGGAVLVAAAGVGGWLLLGRGSSAATAEGGPDPRSIAVLYFSDRSAGGELGYLADGLTEGLIGALGEVRSLHVVSAGGAGQVRGSSLPLDSIARLLGAGTIVRGELEPDGGDVRVTVRLADASGAEFERASFRRPAADALGLQDSLVEQASRLVRRRLGEEIRVRRERVGTENPEAWVLLQRAQRLAKEADSVAALADATLYTAVWDRADSTAAVAEAVDRSWPDAIVLRAALAYRRARRAVDDPLEADRWIAAGVDMADRALAIDPRTADALELRGNLQYWKWLLQLEPEPARADSLLRRAQRDLERAVELRPQQAGAWASLSHLYNQLPDKSGVDVVLAARSAYEADAFLSNADVILTRLFFGQYDLGGSQLADARRTCEIGARRFADNPRFVECRLWMLTTGAEPPDPPAAWRLRDSLLALTPEAERAYYALSSRLAVAAVLARAGLGDSARAVVRSSRSGADVDPTRDLANISAFVYGLLGDTSAAVEQLSTYLAVNPGRRSALAQDPGWWFRPIAASPAFGRLVGSGR